MSSSKVNVLDDVKRPDHGYGISMGLSYDPSFRINNAGEPIHVKDFPRGFAGRFIDSFKRNPDLRVAPLEVVLAHGRVFDSKHAAQNTANSALVRKLKGRHLQMIAIGGSIGTGLFVISGKALATGGPASVIIAFSLIGMMLYSTCHALGEMAVLLPVAGSFSTYSTRFLDPAWGFAMGWNGYALQWLVILPTEVIAASVTINYWGSDLPHAIFVTIFLIVIVAINLVGIKGYGEAEFVFSIIKVIAVIGFILIGVIINCGGTKDTGYIGGKYWRDPGAFNGGFKGLCSVLVNAAFAFGGTELVGLAASETSNPRKSLPSAVKQVFWRITLFYTVSLTIVGLNVRYNDDKLLQTESAATAASPFIIAIEDAGITILPSVMNAVILVAVLSVGNSSIFGSSRTLAALAHQGQAPKIFGYIDRKGRPIVAIALASSLGLIAYTADSNYSGDILAWLSATSGLSSIFTWGSICLAHIRFRAAWAHRQRSLDELAFRSQPGVIGSWIGFGFNCLILLAQFWVAIWPQGYNTIPRHLRAENFFLMCTAAPVVFIMYLAYKLYYRTCILRVADMDLRTGVRELNLGETLRAEREEMASWPAWKRIYKLVC